MMKRYLMKFSVFLILCLAIFLLINRLYTNTNYWKSENNVYKFNNIPDDIELANVGSSHAVFAFKYDTIPYIKAFNFALAAQPYFYDYAVLNKYISHMAENAVVLIPISYFGITRGERYSLFRKRYYRFLNRDEMDYWSLKEYLIYAKYPVLSAGINKTRLFRDMTAKQISPFYNHDSHLEEDKIYDYCLAKYEEWTSPDLEQGQKGYEHNIQAVSKIIDLCYSHKLQPVLISTPVTDVLNSIFEEDKDFFTTFDKFGRDLCKKYSGLVFLDYSRSRDFSNKHELFADGDHLNNAGSELFTKDVVKELKMLGLLR